MRGDTWEIGDIVSSPEFVRGRSMGSIVLVGVQGSKIDLDAYDETRMDSRYLVESVEALKEREQLAVHHQRDPPAYVVTARRMRNNQYKLNGERIQWTTAGDGMNVIPESRIKYLGRASDI